MKRLDNELVVKKPKRLHHRVLVSGGCGFIGVNLVNLLLRNGFSHIKILDNLSTGTKENLETALHENGEIISQVNLNHIIYNYKYFSGQNMQHDPIVELTIGDIRSYETCKETTKDIDSVIHLAAHTGVIPSIENPLYDLEVNVIGTLNLLRASTQNGVDRFIFASSGAPLGNQSPPLNENKIPKPLSPYGASKLAGEGYCSAFFGSYGLKTVSLRFSNVYGPYSTFKNSVIAIFFKNIFDGKFLTIYGDGSQTRDFLFVSDLCDAVYKTIKFENRKGNKNSSHSEPWGSTLQIASGFETSINNLFYNIASLVESEKRKKIDFKFEPYRKGEILRNYSDISRAKKILGFHPKFSLEEGLRITRDWFLKNYKK